jgi:hypothetical protein
MTKRHLFPRGFEVTEDSEVDVTKRNDGDTEVEFLYRVYINHEPGYDTWEFRSEVFRAAKRLIGLSITGWAARHDFSKYLHLNARNFMADTIRFIETGSRTMHSRNWLDLLETGPSPLPTAITDSKAGLSTELISNSTLYIQKWVSHKGGFEDLLTSLLIMYGPGLPSTKQRIGIDQISPKNPKLQALTAAITRRVQPLEEFN